MVLRLHIKTILSMFAEYFSPVVQWIECQIPVLMMGVRVPSGEQVKAFLLKGFLHLIGP